MLPLYHQATVKVKKQNTVIWSNEKKHARHFTFFHHFVVLCILVGWSERYDSSGNWWQPWLQ